MLHARSCIHFQCFPHARRPPYALRTPSKLRFTLGHFPHLFLILLGSPWGCGSMVPQWGNFIHPFLEGDATSIVRLHWLRLLHDRRLCARALEFFRQISLELIKSFINSAVDLLKLGLKLDFNAATDARPHCIFTQSIARHRCSPCSWVLEVVGWWWLEVVSGGRWWALETLFSNARTI